MPKKPKLRSLTGEFLPLALAGENIAADFAPRPGREKEDLECCKKNWKRHDEDVRKYLNHAHETYKETINPLAYWGAFLTVRRRNAWGRFVNFHLPEKERFKDEPMPEWVLLYFEGIAEKLMDPQCTYEDTMKHLGFKSKSGPGPFKKFRNLEIRNYAVNIVLQEIQRGSDLKSAVNSAGRWTAAFFEINISTHSIEAWVKHHDKTCRLKKEGEKKKRKTKK